MRGEAFVAFFFPAPDSFESVFVKSLELISRAVHAILPCWLLVDLLCVCRSSCALDSLLSSLVAQPNVKFICMPTGV